MKCLPALGFKIQRRGKPTPTNTNTHTMQHYMPRPLRETPAHRRTQYIQQELDLMRAIYARQLDNQHRRDAMVGYGLLAIALIVPAVVAIGILIF